MPVVIEGQTYYRPAEVRRMVGICRNTLLKWAKTDKVLTKTEYRDFRGWRLYTVTQVQQLKAKMGKISIIERDD